MKKTIEAADEHLSVPAEAPETDGSIGAEPPLPPESMTDDDPLVSKKRSVKRGELSPSLGKHKDLPVSGGRISKRRRRGRGTDDRVETEGVAEEPLPLDAAASSTAELESKVSLGKALPKESRGGGGVRFWRRLLPSGAARFANRSTTSVPELSVVSEPLPPEFDDVAPKPRSVASGGVRDGGRRTGGAVSFTLPLPTGGRPLEGSEEKVEEIDDARLRRLVSAPGAVAVYPVGGEGRGESFRSEESEESSGASTFARVEVVGGEPIVGFTVEDERARRYRSRASLEEQVRERVFAHPVSVKGKVIKSEQEQRGRRRLIRWSLFVASAAGVVVLVLGLAGLYTPSRDDERYNSPSPNAMFSSSPSISQSNEPSYRPSGYPTQQPSASSCPSQMPSAQPSIFPTSERWDMLMPIVSNVTRDEDAFYDSASPQSKALQWLADVDEVTPTLDLLEEKDRVITRYILAVFFYSTGGKDWLNRLSFLDATRHECLWHQEMGGLKVGASCHPPEEQIVFLGVVENNLTGTLTDEICHLKSLRLLAMWDNKLGGSIPSCIGDLANLEVLLLQNNYFLTGPLPTSIGNLVELVHLELFQNQLNGTIPLSVGNLVNLAVLDLVENKLSGTIPTTLGNMSSLEELFLGGNHLSGAIPMSLNELHNLKSLSLGHNSLQGTVPLAEGSFPSLTSLYLNDNLLSGSLPKSISTYSSLDWFEAQSNVLNGTIPSELSQLTNLQLLTLHDNAFSGSIPTSLGSMTNLGVLNIGQNLLSGELTSFLGDLQHLRVLSVGNNSLTGDIPSQIGQLSRLIILFLNDNKLQGHIPTQLGNLPTLEWLDFSSNELSGMVPSALFPTGSFYVPYPLVFLHKNNLTGDLDDFCENKGAIDILISADCMEPNSELRCSCCRHCCDRDDDCDPPVPDLGSVEFVDVIYQLYLDLLASVNAI